jgi:hypothetical protein
MCLWTIFCITFSKSVPIVDRRLIGRKVVWGILGPYPGLVRLSHSLPSMTSGSARSEGSDQSNELRQLVVFLEDV